MSTDSKDVKRSQFFKSFIQDRLAIIREHGPATFDQGRILYESASSQRTVFVSDAFVQGSDVGDVREFLSHLHSQWWDTRKSFSGDGSESDFCRLSGLYGRFLPEVGYDFIIEFGDAGGSMPLACWRVDAVGRTTKLSNPQDELMFHGQTGTFFNLRAGWRNLVLEHRKTHELLVHNVENGYVIGVRRGDSSEEDPAHRVDPELEYAFSQYIDYEFDTVEFIGSKAAQNYPFVGERYTEWLGDAASSVHGGDVELFVLASSDSFIMVLDEVCEQRGLRFTSTNTHDNLEGTFHCGALSIHLDLGTLFLRTVHTGRSFASGVRDFVLPSLDALESAHHLYQMLSERISRYDIKVEDGSVLVVSDPKNQAEIGRWNLLGLSALSQEHGQRLAESTLKFLGFDPETGLLSSNGLDLETCSVCQGAARVGKVIRPNAALGVDPRRLLGVPVGNHTVYFTLECNEHVLPISPQPDLSVSDLEEAYRRGLDRSTLTIAACKTLEPDIPAMIVVAYDAGSLILEPGRIKAVVDAMGIESNGPLSLYGFFPDALVIAQRTLTGPECRRARNWAQEMIEPLYPTRMWALDVSRQAEVGNQSIGRVEI